MSDRRSYAAHARALIVLAMPIVGGHLAQMALGVTDTAMLGWYGTRELAAMVLSASCFFFLFILGSGFGVVLMGMLSAALAQDDRRQVRRVTRMGLWLSVLYGVLVLPLFLWSGPILLALGQEPDIADLAQTYLRIVGFGMVPALAVMVMKSFYAAIERAGVGLWVTLAGVFVNAALNWALIFGNWGASELGLRGAAVATLAVQVMSAVLLLAGSTILAEARPFALLTRFWRPDWPAFAQVFSLGLRVGLTLLAESALFSGAAIMMGWVGTVELAAHGIALQVASLCFMLYLGLSNAATVKVGYAWGAGDAATLRETALAALAITVGICTLVVAMMVTLPGPIIDLFLDDANPDRGAILAYGAVLLVWAAVFQIFDALQVIALGFLRGVQDIRVPMWLAAFSYWIVGMPASYLLAFPFGLGGIGIWLGLVIGLASASSLLMARFWRGRTRRVAV